MIRDQDLIKLLQQLGLLKEGDSSVLLSEAEKKRVKLEDLILDKKIIDSEKLYQVKAGYYGLPYIDLNGKKIEEKALNKIPKTVAENYKIVCFEMEDRKIKVGITDPDNFKAIEAIDYLAKDDNLQVEYYLISNNSFTKSFSGYSSLDKELDSAIHDKENVTEVVEKKEEQINEVTKSAPVIKIVSVIIRHAVEGKASDIHIEPMPKESRVRYRIDGILHTSLILPRSVHEAIVARIKVMANLKLDETRIPQDGRIRMAVGEKDYDLRVSTLPLVGSEKVVMRVLDTNKGAPTLESLGFEGLQYEAIQRVLKSTEGIVLVAGPTGSGKSTTLFSVLDIMNKEDVNIATLEDPVEYTIKGANQSQVKPEIGYTFAAGLRSFLRQDPDIIMVGEIRDSETAELATHAALTGHLVFSTIHTMNSLAAVTRLLDMGVELFLMAMTMKAVIAQRLVRKICSNCIEENVVPVEFQETIRKEITNIPEEYIKTLVKDYDSQNLHFFHGKGCAKCGNTGYSGRVSIVEVLEVDTAIKNLLLSGQKSLSIADVSASRAFITIKQDGLIKCLEGKTTLDEVLRVMKD